MKFLLIVLSNLNNCLMLITLYFIRKPFFLYKTHISEITLRFQCFVLAIDHFSSPLWSFLQLLFLITLGIQFIYCRSVYYALYRKVETNIQEMKCMASFPISTFMYLGEIYIFPRSVLFGISFTLKAKKKLTIWYLYCILTSPSFAVCIFCNASDPDSPESESRHFSDSGSGSRLWEIHIQ